MYSSLHEKVLENIEEKAIYNIARVDVGKKYYIKILSGAAARTGGFNKEKGMRSL